MVLRKMLSLQSDPISSEELVVESDIMVWPSVIAHQITDGVSSLCSSVKVLLQGKKYGRDLILYHCVSDVPPLM